MISGYSNCVGVTLIFTIRALYSSRPTCKVNMILIKIDWTYYLQLFSQSQLGLRFLLFQRLRWLTDEVFCLWHWPIGLPVRDVSAELFLLLVAPSLVLPSAAPPRRFRAR